MLARTAPDRVADSTPAGVTDEDDELRDLFAGYNPAVWPMHLLAHLLGALVLVLVVRRPGRATDRFTSGVLAAVWLWLGVVFFGRHAAQTDPLLGAIYGAMFVSQAVLFARAGIVHDRLAFAGRTGVAGRIGWAAIGYALVVYPLLGVAGGHGYPASPLFGLSLIHI